MSPIWRWVIVVCYAISLPFMRGAWEAVRRRGAGLANALPLVAGSVLAAALGSYLLLVKREKRALVYFLLIFIGFAYACVFRTLSQPIERIHLAQYGLLSVLVFWAMYRGSEGPSLSLWAIVVTVELGLADECVQGLLPPRIYDLNDVILNAKAALLGQAVVILILRPWELAGRPLAGISAEGGGKGLNLLRLGIVLLLLAVAVNIFLVEMGTPTVFEDVHRGDGILRNRDGFIHFGAVPLLLNAVVIGILLAAMILSRTDRGPAAQRLRTVVACGLITPAVLVAGRLLGLKFR